MNSISVLLVVSMVFWAHGAPLSGIGNSMNQEFHATALIPMLTGTNVPESEEEIDAPIYDQDEIDKVKGLVKQTIDSKGDLEKTPVLGDFVKANPGILATAEAIKASGTDLILEYTTSPGPIFTLAGGFPTVAITTRAA